MSTLAIYEQRPEFQRRAAALAPKLRAAVMRGESTVDGSAIAKELGVPLDIAATWIAMRIAFPLGKMRMRLAVKNRLAS